MILPNQNAGENQKIALTLGQEAQERRIASNLKPFAGALRVTNPVR
jgi:hypothetical protein